MRCIKSFVAATGFSLAVATPVYAEFQIQEAGIEKGETEVEYRGAYHWGVTSTNVNENANDVVQSHEMEISHGFSDWFLLQFTAGSEQALGENLQMSDVELEAEFALLKREGDGVAISFQGGYQQAINHSSNGGSPNQIGFGPIVELATGKLLLTLNPIFNKQVGNYSNQKGLGFEYGWRAQYNVTQKWAVGAEMFGDIESLATAGSFNDQVHSIGPTLFYNPSGQEEGEGTSDDNGTDKPAGPTPIELSLNVGVQFGLTDATSDTALKFQGSLSF